MMVSDPKLSKSAVLEALSERFDAVRVGRPLGARPAKIRGLPTAFAADIAKVTEELAVRR